MKSFDKNNDGQMILDLKSGDILAFNRIFELYSSKLFHFAKVYLGSDADSEELVQEVFSILWERRNQLKDGFSFQSYLFTIAFNIIKKHFRQKKLFKNFAREELLKGEETEPSEQIDYASLKQYILRLCEAFPPQRREVFMRSRFEGLSNQEIADQLGLSKKTIENHLNLALREIRTKIEKSGFAVFLFYFIFIR
ncbi:MAG: RNA polymerase sigma-70 factor [Prolixibacteraceae bacterium]